MMKQEKLIIVMISSTSAFQFQNRGAVWLGSILFAIPSASFGLITLW